MDDLNQESAPPTGAPNPGDITPDTSHQEDYTMSVIGTNQAYQAFLRGLPPELRSKIERFTTRELTEYLSGNQADPGLAALLPQLRTIQSREILTKVYPPIQWVVPDYLPPGLTFLSGKPKVRKSWLALQLALAVMTGGKVFGQDVQKGKVLYLALEDSERRLQDRMRKQSWPTTSSIDVMLFEAFNEQIGALNSGGGKRLLAYIETQKYRLVIVDTFSRAVSGDQLDPNEMTAAIGPLQCYAMTSGIGLVIIDHMPKNTGPDTDPITHVFGSVAKAAVLDTIWGLYKEQGKYGAKLAITGREANECTLKLVWDTPGCYWHCEGDAHEIEMTERRKEVLEILKELGKATLQDIAKALGKDPGNTFKRLCDLCNDGVVEREKGLYSLVSG